MSSFTVGHMFFKLWCKARAVCLPRLLAMAPLPILTKGSFSIQLCPYFDSCSNQSILRLLFITSIRPWAPISHNPTNFCRRALLFFSARKLFHSSWALLTVKSSAEVLSFGTFYSTRQRPLAIFASHTNRSCWEILVLLKKKTLRNL